ncbi:hypothetical protein [Paraburkholderia sp. Ac-20347]|uniref:hypothetical protein n=1 Tax=Paraburkholderia sp. Ac-20347 TaxID=2703892 RepID=UPI00197E4BF8|nr:hypothetical protein [Paraburkholderia sp. Ac-20347]MBN3809413.1 hypothetical protein [Paraburkholderia sp. Ac-20347]
MAIIGTLPDNLQNGTTADASQVMADLNYIVNQVNSNANPLGTLTAPSGTRMAFHQAAAPSGWAIDTSITNHTCLYSATGGGTIVSTGAGYTSFCYSGWAADNHTLTIGEMPGHSHTDAGHSHGITDPGHTHTPPAGAFLTNASNANVASTGGAYAAYSTTAAATTGISVNNGAANLQNTGGSGAHAHTITTTWQYITMCVAQKS